MPEGPTQSESPSLAFGRNHRLIRRADFTRAYGRGRKAYGQFVAIFALRQSESTEDEPGPWRLGITATRKSGKAVDRNRQRRRIREFFRLHQHALPPGWDFVVNTRRSLNEAGHREFHKDMERALRKLGFDLSGENPA